MNLRGGRECYSELPEAEAKAIHSFGLMTAKPILYVANVDETDLEDVTHDHLKFFFDDGSDPMVTKISPRHEADLVDFRDRFENVFPHP